MTSIPIGQIMSTFKPIFSLGYAFRAAVDGSARQETAPASLVFDDNIEGGYIDSKQKPAFSEAIANFAKSHLDMVLVDRSNLAATALASTYYPVRDDELIQWDQPLFDSDGFPHSLVAMNALDVVTRCSISFAVWNRKTGACKMPDTHGYTIGNTPMSNATRALRREEVLQTLRSNPVMFEQDKRELAQRLASIPMPPTQAKPSEGLSVPLQLHQTGDMADVILLEPIANQWQWTITQVGLEQEFNRGGPFPDVGSAHQDALAKWSKWGHDPQALDQSPPIVEIKYTPQQIDSMARAFVLGLQQAIGLDDMAQVIQLNKMETDPNICHSHDLCDANMVMAEAQIQVLGFAPDVQSESQTQLWNAAWSSAKAIMNQADLLDLIRQAPGRPVDR